MAAILIMAAATNNQPSTAQSSLTPRPSTLLLTVLFVTWLASRLGKGVRR